jgi:hypothetical protein
MAIASRDKAGEFELLGARKELLYAFFRSENNS